MTTTWLREQLSEQTLSVSMEIFWKALRLPMAILLDMESIMHHNYSSLGNMKEVEE